MRVEKVPRRGEAVKLDSAVAMERGRRPPLRLYALTLTTFLAAAGAPSPLYRIYQETWGFSPAVLTLIFAVYAVSLLVALLTTGSLSDHVGRKPVILAALVLEIVAVILFMVATGPGWLIAARIVQGFATGAATSALSAGLVDADPKRGALVNGLAPLVGLAAGALGCSALVDYAPAPLRLVFAVLLGAFALECLFVLGAAETTARRPGALASLRPRFNVPPASLGNFLAATPMSVATWALGGFYLSLIPTVVRHATGSSLALTGGAAIAALTFTGAVATLVARPFASRRIILVASLVLILGVALTLMGILAGSVAAILVGTMVSGIGFGAGFLGALRITLTDVLAKDRAGLLSAFYIVSYLAFSIPAMLAGVVIHLVGLVPTALGYGGGVILLSLVASISVSAPNRRRQRRPREP